MLGKIGKLVLGLVAALALLLAILYLRLAQPLPSGQAGPAADQRARQLQLAVNQAAWERTGAVRWTFVGRHHHLWDRQRRLARVRWDDNEVQIDLNQGKGVARRRGQNLDAAQTAPLVKTALGHWRNDSFWLNPIAKLFDKGTVRQLIALPAGEQGLLVTFAQGGATPGDSYLWSWSADGLPRACQMWVSVLPIGGLEFSWEGWTNLSTGARLALDHRIGPIELHVTDVAAATSLNQLVPGADPFAELIEHLQHN